MIWIHDRGFGRNRIKRSVTRKSEAEVHEWCMNGQTVERFLSYRNTYQRASTTEDSLNDRWTKWHTLWCQPLSPTTQCLLNGLINKVATVSGMEATHGINVDFQLLRLNWLTLFIDGCQNQSTAETNIQSLICHQLLLSSHDIKRKGAFWGLFYCLLIHCTGVEMYVEKCI